MDTLRKTVERLGGGEDAVLVTVVATEGSVPPRVGFRMAVTGAGEEGTVGGGALEKEAVRLARKLLAEGGEGRLERIEVSKLDMTCGGAVTLFFEPFRAAQSLWIFGGGHIGKALVPMAAAAGFSVTVADNRPEYADRARFPEAVRTVCAPYPESVAMVPKGAFVVITTHGHAHDEEVLNAMARFSPRLPYVGMIGSSHKIAKALSDMRAAGIDPGPDVYAPVGLDLGGDTPGEIALAIAAQILGVRHKKTGLPHYRDRHVPK
ncbi:MAG: XdhC/CoxI family protein [Deltaproteobacteria bacterium]|nr:XdhC/CoxI family protein [Deltaproteobacteria bacterium]